MASRNFDKTYKNATLSEGKKEQLISDGGNLYMRLRSGKKGVKKSWQFNYHHPLTKKRIKLALGDYPELSLEDARDKSSEYRKLLKKKHRSTRVRANRRGQCDRHNKDPLQRCGSTVG